MSSVCGTCRSSASVCAKKQTSRSQSRPLLQSWMRYFSGCSQVSKTLCECTHLSPFGQVFCTSSASIRHVIHGLSCYLIADITGCRHSKQKKGNRYATRHKIAFDGSFNISYRPFLTLGRTQACTYGSSDPFVQLSLQDAHKGICSNLDSSHAYKARPETAHHRTSSS